MTAKRVREGTSIGEQALEEAMADRWNYIRNPPSERKTPVSWLQYGVQLDEESEHELRDRALDKLVDVRADLEGLKLKRRR